MLGKIFIILIVVVCWNQIIVSVKFRGVDIHHFANIKSNECVRPVG